jgi:hypothetical protein
MMASFEELPPHLQQRKQTQKGHRKLTFNGTYNGGVPTR